MRYKCIHPRTNHVVEGVDIDYMSLNRKGYNIYQFLHKTDTRRRHARGGDVRQVACFFADADGNLHDVIDRADTVLQPSKVVFTGSPDSGHLYWKLDGAVGADGYEETQRAIAKILGTDGVVCDRARVVRVPGTVNHATGATAQVLYDAPKTYSRQDVEEAFGVEKAQPGAQELRPKKGATFETEVLPVAIPKLLGRYVSRGLEAPSSRYSTMLTFIQLCVWRRLSETYSLSQWYHCLRQRPENSKEVTAGNWDKIAKEFKNAFRSWSKRGEPLYRCADCGRLLPAGEYYKDRSRRSGLCRRCKGCHAKKVREYQRKRRGSVRRYKEKVTPSKADYITRLHDALAGRLSAGPGWKSTLETQPRTQPRTKPRIKARTKARTKAVYSQYNPIQSNTADVANAAVVANTASFSSSSSNTETKKKKEIPSGYSVAGGYAGPGGFVWMYKGPDGVPVTESEMYARAAKAEKTRKNGT